MSLYATARISTILLYSARMASMLSVKSRIKYSLEKELSTLLFSKKVMNVQSIMPSIKKVKLVPVTSNVSLW
ncbi:hypothetical protein D3C72_1788040 [compost metagenome]